MAEQPTDLAELLQGIDGPRSLPPVLRHRLEGVLTGSAVSAPYVGVQVLDPAQPLDPARPLDPTLADHLAAALTAAGSDAPEASMGAGGDEAVALALVGVDRPRSLPPGLSDRLSGQILTQSIRPSPLAENKPASVRLAGRWQRVLAGAAAAALLVAAGVGIGLHSGQSSTSSTTASGPARSGGPAFNSAGGISSGAPLAPTAGSGGASGLLSGPQSAVGPTSSTGAAGSGSASSSAGSSGGAAAGTEPGPPPPSAAAEAAPNASPGVQSVSPRQGPTTGGTWVTITGTQLNGATVVHFGTVSATQVVVEPNGQMRALSPAHLPGSVDVLVTTPAGTTPATPGDVFDFIA